MPDRWTPETTELVGDAIVDANSLTGMIDPTVQAILAALVDDGLLVPPGGETREHYEVQTPGVRYPSGDREYIWRTYGELRGRGTQAQMLRQHVTAWPDGREYRTPWEVVDDHS